MKRKLFFSEFKRALVPTATVYALLLILNRALMYLDSSKDARNALDLFFGGVLVLSGFLSGVRPFSAEFKTRHSLLLQTLPLGRGWIWTILVSASLLASFFCLAVILLLRSSLLINPSLALFGFSLYVFLFSAGCCYALLHERAYVIYVVGFASVATVLGLVGLYAEFFAGATGSGSLVAEDWRQSQWQSALYLTMVGVGVLSILYFALSYHFFTSGEFLLWRTRIRNYATLLVSLASVLILMDYGVPKAIESLGPWRAWEFRISPDGKRLMVLEAIGESSFSKIDVIDAGTGAKLGDFRFHSVRHYTNVSTIWSKKGDVLNVLVSETSPLYALLHSPEDSIQRLSHEGKVLNKQVLPGAVVDMSFDRAGNILTVIWSEKGVTIVLVASETGDAKELANPGPGWASIRPIGQEVLILFSGDSNSKAFVYDSSLKEVKCKSDSRLYEGTYWMNDTVYVSPAQFRKEVMSTYPPPQGLAQKGHGNYLFPRPLTRVPPLFYVYADEAQRSAALYVSTGPSGYWKQLGAGIPLTGTDVAALSREEGLSALSGVNIDYFLRVAAFLTAKDGGKELKVFDMSQNSVTSAMLPPSAAETTVNSDMVWGSDGILIETSHALSSDESKQDRAFSYMPGTSGLEEVKLGARLDALLYRDQSGHEIFREANWDENRWFESIVAVDPTGQKRRLWPPQAQSEAHPNNKEQTDAR